MDLEKKAQVPWNDDTEYAFGFIRFYGKLLGTWPLDRESIFPAVRFAIFISILLSIIITYVKNLLTIGYCGKILDLVEIFTVLILSTGSLCKVVIPWCSVPKLYFVINSIAEDWTKIYDKKSYEIMIAYAYKGRLVFIIQYIVTSSLIIVQITLRLPNTLEVFDGTTNITNIIRVPPYGPSCWVSITMSENSYHAYYLYICFHWFCSALTYVSNDVYMFGIGMHMCGQLELLYSELKEINCDDDDHHAQREKLIRLIDRHSRLLNILQTMEDVFNLIILIEAIANTLVISINGIMLLWGIKLRSKAMAIPKAVRLYVFFAEIFMVSYVGEALTSHTERLQEAVWDLLVYNLSVKTMKDVLFILMRIHYPFYLTAGKVLNMNFETFKNFVKTTFSYFSVLRLVLDV